MRARIRKLLDSLAVALSGVCAVHCLALPLVVVAYPLLGSWSMDELLFHRLLLIVIIPVSLIALLLGYYTHRSRQVAVLGTLGIAILALVAVSGHDWLSMTGERLATTAGGLILASGHLINAVIAQRCRMI